MLDHALRQRLAHGGFNTGFLEDVPDPLAHWGQSIW
jgi:hypothetical protein